MISAGREDVDVRMLGRGRPFALELSDPKVATCSTDQLAEVTAQLLADPDAYGGVQVRALQLITSEQLKGLKAGEEHKRKEYVARVRLDRPVTPEDAAQLSGLTDLAVAQRTPVRVSQRRSDLVRHKVIHKMRVEMVLEGDGREFDLFMTTSAGTYVKEFVHGDRGRTDPCVGVLLGCKAEILSLDVLEILMDWL